MKCLFCNEDFMQTRAWAKFCSEKCRNDYHNQKKLEKKEEENKAKERERVKLENTIIKCPHCLTDDPSMFEVIYPPSVFFCNVCAKTFNQEI